MTLGIGHDSLQRLTCVLVVMVTRVFRRIIPCRFHTYIKYKDKACGTVPCTCYVWVGPATLLSVWSLHSTLHMLLLGGVCTLPCSYFGVGSVPYPAFVYFWVGTAGTLPCSSFFWVGFVLYPVVLLSGWGLYSTLLLEFLGGVCTLPCSWCF